MKKKLRLDVEDLKVEAFATADGTAKYGTVRGHGGGPYPTDVCESWAFTCTLGGDECTKDGSSCSGPYDCIC